MPAKNRFNRFDAFAKTVEDARVRTTSGGIVTITSLLIILWLAWGEWRDYRRVIVRPELIVDKGRGGLSFLRGLPQVLDASVNYKALGAARLAAIPIPENMLTIRPQERRWRFP